MFIYIYICIYSPKPAVPAHSPFPKRPPAFQQYYAEEIGCTTPVIFNWVEELHVQNADNHSTVCRNKNFMFKMQKITVPCVGIFIQPKRHK